MSVMLHVHQMHTTSIRHAPSIEVDVQVARRAVVLSRLVGPDDVVGGPARAGRVIREEGHARRVACLGSWTIE